MTHGRAAGSSTTAAAIKLKRAIIVALLLAGCSDASYPRLESAPNTYTASQVWLAERFGPVTYCWSENASAPGTCTYTRAQCLEVSRARTAFANPQDGSDDVRMIIVKHNGVGIH